MTFVLAVSGWRKRPDPSYITRYLTLKLDVIRSLFHVGRVAIRVGDCPTGVDAMVRDWIKVNDLPHRVYEADWDRYGKGAGPIRNRNMLLGINGSPSTPESLPAIRRADLLLAFPQPGSYPYKGSGTWNCIGQAWELGIRVELGASLGPGITVNNLSVGPSPADG